MNAAPEQPTDEAKAELATLRIDAALHSLLKAKAKAEGRVLKRMAEDQLRLLLAPVQLSLVESGEGGR